MSHALRLIVVIACLCYGVHALDNGAGLKPPMGWSTWCSEGKCGNDYCSEEMVRQGASVLVDSGMKELGWDFIVLDDCWVDSRDANGTLTPDPTKFPSGMAKLTSDLHAMGLNFGLYTSAGNTTCNSHGEGHPTPGSEGFYQQDADLFASWQLDYVKMDWCGDVKKDPFEGAELYKKFSNAITHTTPARSIFFECVAAYAFLLKDVGQYCNSWRVMADHHDVWSSTSETIIGAHLLGEMVPGSPGAWGYMDILATGGQGCAMGSLAHCPGQTDTEYLTSFSLWSLTQSPLFVATDIRNMTDVMKIALMNKPVLSIHQDTSTPPGRQVATWPCAELLDCTVWARAAATDNSSALVALYNAGKDSHHITAEFSALGVGWDSNTEALVQDLWPSTTVGLKMVSAPVVESAQGAVVKGSLVAEVPSHGVAFVLLKKSA